MNHLYAPLTDAEKAHAMFCYGMSPEGLARKIDTAGAQATAYVWGRQDAGESARDTGYSLDFGDWYAARTRGFYGGSEPAGAFHNIERAYATWRTESAQVSA